ncbi:MAG TPA: tetratricopeptide repeat protein, partial [Phototrophicaceae bacterium]|nr:tetratricopeptide repeat protein [Phototrophicaceae bacterium]
MLRFLFILVFVLNFHGVYQADPDVCDPAADYLTLAKQDIENKTYDSALEKLACAEQYEPSNPEIFFNRGVVYFHLKQFPEAIQDYTRAIENSPNIEAPFYLRSLYLRGVLHRDLSDNEAALSDLNACLEAASQITDPDLYGGEIGLAELYIDRGGIYERLHDLEQALAD